MNKEVTNHIRKAVPEDNATIAALMTELGYPQTAAVVDQQLAILYKDPNYTILMAEIDGVVVGMMTITIRLNLSDSYSHAYINALIVTEGYRSKGIGARLLQAAEDVAHQFNVDRVTLNSRLHNEASHRFYRRHGFEVTSYKFTRKIAPQNPN